MAWMSFQWLESAMTDDFCLDQLYVQKKTTHTHTHTERERKGEREQVVMAQQSSFTEM